ncbi:hypothetical protein [Bradyrhizobium sp. USDA 4369]
MPDHDRRGRDEPQAGERADETLVIHAGGISGCVERKESLFVSF